MEVKELLQEKETVENRISTFISTEVNEFLKRTGVGLNSVNIVLTDLRGLSSNEVQLYLVSTDIYLDI